MGSTSARHWALGMVALVGSLSEAACSFLLSWTGSKAARPLITRATTRSSEQPVPAPAPVRSDGDNAQAGLLQATLAGLERMARANVEVLHRDPLAFCAMAELMRELGLLARMQNARTDLVRLTLHERIRLEPLPPAVRCIGLELSGNGTTSLQHPLAHFVIVDTLCQAAARWPASERPVITLNVQNAQVKYSCTLRSLSGDEQQRLGLFLSNLDLALMPFKRDLRSTPSAAPGGPHELTILIAA